MARFPRRARRLWAYWRAEQRTLRQGFVALFISSGGDLLAGLALAFMTDSLQRLPGLFLLIPAAIGMRGNIFGALGSRLGTGIHSGQFEPSADRRGFLGQNVMASVFLTLSTSLFLGAAARAATAAFGFATISIWDYLVISVVGGVLGSLVVGGASIGIAVWSHRRAWDLDSVSAPLVTAIGDIATLPALWAASFLVQIRYVTLVLGIAVALVCLAATARGILYHLPLTRRIVIESMPVLVLAGIVDILAGTVIEARLERFITFPALLVLVPPFLEDTNALSGILSSRLASKLHLGVLEPRSVPQPLALVDISINFLFAISVFLMVGVSAELVSLAAGKLSPGLGTMIGISLAAGFLATIASSAVAYYSAIATYRFGFDPDNHGIPIGSSVMDLAGTLCLIAAILMFSVTAHG
ncbi:MAG TPA: magnesium transporter [Actinomycetota bacterium]|nr:magnesium transporter [Actinomycetota bacterium]